jgi:hypothetical protein
LLYGAGAVARSTIHPRLGALTVPLPFWVIRVRGARRRCEALGGCTATVSDSELFVSPARPSGAIVPGNMAVHCSNHDPLADDRWIARTHVSSS